MKQEDIKLGLGEEMTVAEALINGVRFDRVIFVDERLKNKSWGAQSHIVGKSVLMNAYGKNACQQKIDGDREYDGGMVRKYSLVVWVDADDPHVSKKLF